MYVCMYVHTYTNTHAYRMYFLKMCLSIKEYISDHRYERTNITTK